MNGPCLYESRTIKGEASRGFRSKSSVDSWRTELWVISTLSWTPNWLLVW